jgi:flagellar hook-associated protein 2
MPIDSGTGDLLKIVGKDAEFTLDGVAGLKQSSNEFTIAGITYTLKETGAATVTVKNDTEGIFTAVKDFVEMYNGLLDTINTTMFEQKQASYKPLTDTQKKEMTADQIKDWETNAKKGILRNDSLLQRIASEMRSSIYTSVKGISGPYNSLFAVGVKTGDYSTNGKLEIDEDKLKAAIEADPSAINKLFNGSVDYSGQATDGVADKLYDQLKLSLDKINAKAGSAAGDKDLTSTLSKKILSNNKAMNAKIDRMNKQMATYYKQYDAMEKLLQQMQSQQDTITGYLNAGSK